MGAKVDSLRFLGPTATRIVQRWTEMESPDSVPWTPVRKGLADSRVAVVSTAGVSLRRGTPFDESIEEANPWWSDPSARIIPRSTRAADVQIQNIHVNPAFGEADLNCVLPVERLEELVAAGELGSVAPSHYSFIGYTSMPETLLVRAVPAIIDRMHTEGVDIVILVPA